MQRLLYCYNVTSANFSTAKVSKSSIGFANFSTPNKPSYTLVLLMYANFSAPSKLTFYFNEKPSVSLED